MAFQPWAIVLAGGQGERLRSSTEQWFGYPYPKQFCAFSGKRSMLEHTLQRAILLTDRERIVTVLNSEHSRFLREDPPGVVLEQPEGKGTGTAVLLANEYIRSRDKNATVIIFPSDHFVYPEARFVAQLRNLVNSTGVLDNCAVLLGAQAVSVEPDYGWITVATSPESADVGGG